MTKEKRAWVARKPRVTIGCMLLALKREAREGCEKRDDQRAWTVGALGELGDHEMDEIPYGIERIFLATKEYKKGQEEQRMIARRKMSRPEPRSMGKRGSDNLMHRPAV